MAACVPPSTLSTSDVTKTFFQDQDQDIEVQDQDIEVQDQDKDIKNTSRDRSRDETS